MASDRRNLGNDISGCFEFECNITAPAPPFRVVVENAPHHHHVSALLLVAIVVSAFSAFFLLSSLVYFAFFHRRRRFGGAFLFTRASDGGSPPSDGIGEVAAPAFEGSEEPLHHVWYIRTVGLDPATIDKIAVAEYKSGDGLLNGAPGDCSVCLGEFCDGELVRLLPHCGHVFHVPCIDTWLQAHVNCPLCRANVVDTSVPEDISATGIQASEQEPNRTADSETVVQVAAPANFNELPDSSVESSVSRAQREEEEGLPQPVRRSVSMDSPFLDAVVVRLEPQKSFNSAAGEGKHGDVCEQNISRSTGKQGNAQPLEIERPYSSSGRGLFFGNSRISRNSNSLPL